MLEFLGNGDVDDNDDEVVPINMGFTSDSVELLSSPVFLGTSAARETKDGEDCDDEEDEDEVAIDLGFEHAGG